MTVQKLAVLITSVNDIQHTVGFRTFSLNTYNLIRNVMDGKTSFRKAEDRGLFLSRQPREALRSYCLGVRFKLKYAKELGATLIKHYKDIIQVTVQSNDGSNGEKPFNSVASVELIMKGSTFEGFIDQFNTVVEGLRREEIEKWDRQHPDFDPSKEFSDINLE